MVSWSDLGHNLADFRRRRIRIYADLSCCDACKTHRQSCREPADLVEDALDGYL